MAAGMEAARATSFAEEYIVDGVGGYVSDKVITRDAEPFDGLKNV